VADETPTVLRVDDLRIGFGESLPVKGVSFSLRRGERVGLVGESGSGKSLTALSIMRLAHGATVTGRIMLEGQDLLQLPRRKMERIRGGQIAMIYQDPMSSLNPVQTIGRQLVEAIRLHKTLSREQAKHEAIRLLDDVGVPNPEQRIGQYPHEFSGGMRQRVMIAMAMSAQPQVLIADEPTTALDVTTQARIIDLLDRLANEHGTAVILITHDLGVAAGFCESIHVMRDGLVVERGPVDQIYHQPQHPYTKALLASVVDLSIDVNRPIATTGEPAVSSAATTPAPGLTPRSRTANSSDEAVLRIEGVSKSYRLGPGEVTRAVSDASFEIRRGETFGLVGESGSGKSTIARLVLALTPVDSGSVRFDGHDVHSLSSKAMRHLRRRMQIVFQDPYSALNRSHSVKQIVTQPLVAHRIGDRKSRAERVAQMLDLVGLGAEFSYRSPRTLSGGQCQRVAIARALVLDPEFLVLDESVSALDVSIQAQVLNLLRDLQQRLGLTYLFISHDLAVIRYMAQHIAVMKQGVIVEQGSRDELFSNPQHEYTRGLMAAIPVADPVIERQRRRDAQAQEDIDTTLEIGKVQP